MDQRGKVAVWKAASKVCLCWVRPFQTLHCLMVLKILSYCFGAPYVCDELAGNTVMAGAFGHPAFLREHHFYNLKSKTSSLQNISADAVEPLFLSCSETDHTFDTSSRRRAMDILQTEKKTYQLQLFSGVEHGFALRGDMSNPYERKSAQFNRFPRLNCLYCLRLCERAKSSRHHRVV